jgi:hypothetical protein
LEALFQEGAARKMTHDEILEIRKIIMDMKSCLDPSHVACEKCRPGFNERIRKLEDEDSKKFWDKIWAESGPEYEAIFNTSKSDGEGKS